MGGRSGRVGRPSDAAPPHASAGAQPSSEALRAEIAELRAELKHAHRLTMLGTLAGSIAHEFNNILTPIMSYAEMALDEPRDAALAQKALERAYRGCDRASRIAAAILAFAGERASAGDAWADVGDAVREAMECLPTDPAQSGVVVAIEIQSKCRAAIDRIGLQQIVLNLVLNALRAMRHRPGKLTIRGFTRRAVFERSTWNNQREDVVVEVEDTGCGIAAERLSRLFAPFAGRGDQSDGTGLGLTICKQLVEGAGGAISVRSRVDEGTCFTILLPPAAETSEPPRHERVNASGM